MGVIFTVGSHASIHISAKITQKLFYLFDRASTHSHWSIFIQLFIILETVSSLLVSSRLILIQNRFFLYFLEYINSFQVCNQFIKV